jgi:hypothetical protein
MSTVTAPSPTLGQQLPPELYFKTTGTTLPLPEPQTEPGQPTDALGMMMVLMEEMARLGTEHSESKIEANRESQAEAMAEFQRKIEEAIKKQQEKEEEADDGWGFFGDLVDAVCDFVGTIVGEVVGPIVEHVVDVIRAPIDIVVGLCKGEALVDLMEQEVNDIESQGKLGKTVTEAVKGIVNFVKDIVNAVTGLLEALTSGENPLSALANLGEDAWNSLCNNVLENPAVMEVLGVVMKVVAVAATLVSGGILGPIAAGLYLLSELEQHFGLCEKAFGKEVGQWVSVGVQLVASVVGVIASGGTDTGALGNIQQTLAYVGAGMQLASGVNNLIEAGRDRDLAHNAADLQGIMNRMAQLQRMMETLLTELQERVEGRGRNRESGLKLSQIQGEGLEATVYLKA